MKTLVSQHHISAFYNMLILCISVHNTESIVQSVVRWNEMRFKYKTEQQPLKRVEKRKLSCNFTFPSSFLCIYHTYVYIQNIIWARANERARACVSVLFSVLFKNVSTTLYCVLYVAQKPLRSIVSCHQPKYSHTAIINMHFMILNLCYHNCGTMKWNGTKFQLIENFLNTIIKRFMCFIKVLIARVCHKC